MSNVGGGDEFYTAYNPRVHSKIAEREGFILSSDEPRTLWVGNLDPAITDDFLATLFNKIGIVVKTKIIHDGLNDPYAFVEFSDHNQASQALQSMNKRLLLQKEMRVNWAIEPGQPSDRAKPDATRLFHVFVGDLSPEVDNQKLKEAFQPYGNVTEAKIIRDTQTNKSKGYGFVSFLKREEAERAIEQMNGQWLGRRTIRTNWASRKPGDEGGSGGGGGGGGFGGGRREERHDRFEKSYEEVYNSTGPDNTTVYVGNIATLTEENMRIAFSIFGRIAEVKIFKIQGYAFVKFEEKPAATKAIVEMNNQDINGQTVRCSWGKTGDSGKQDRGGNYGYGYGYGPGGPGGPPQGFPPNFGGPGPSGPPGGPQGGNYWQHYSQYYNNPQLMQQWSNYWQQHGGGSGGPPPGRGGGPSHHHK